MLEFQLFRIKVVQLSQTALFSRRDIKPSELLKEAIVSLPKDDKERMLIWHIGNIEEVDNNGLYFRIGRTTPQTTERYKDGVFVEEMDEIAPYTHVLIDIEKEVCAIAKKIKVSPTSKGTARQLIRLLNYSEIKKRDNIEFEISDIKDPDDFISHIKKAHSVSKYWLTFSRPNPIDNDDLVVKPLEAMLQGLGADKGKTEFDGKDLDRERLETLSRSIAATGEEAGATIKKNEKDRGTRRRLRGNPVIIKVEDVAREKGHHLELLKIIRSTYENIRRKNNDKE
ncbi:MAG: hypothetical protein WC624_00480 [Candidatus Margulisiibacteriota bacterium]